MSGKKSVICHGCKGVGHFFGTCPIKRRCPYCRHGFQKFFVVERDGPNKSRFFKCYSLKCGFWDWCEAREVTGESSNTRIPLARPTNPVTTDVDDMSRMFESQMRLNNDEELLISMNVNVSVRRGR